VDFPARYIDLPLARLDLTPPHVASDASGMSKSSGTQGVCVRRGRLSAARARLERTNGTSGLRARAERRPHFGIADAFDCALTADPTRIGTTTRTTPTTTPTTTLTTTTGTKTP